jgi:hypothetical protein
VLAEGDQQRDAAHRGGSTIGRFTSVSSTV